MEVNYSFVMSFYNIFRKQEPARDISTCNSCKIVLHPTFAPLCPFYSGSRSINLVCVELADGFVADLHRAGRDDYLDGIELIELKGYNRQQVNILMCAANCLLMTSKTEGSPQVIKEAMACGLPIVSTNVGDVAERLKGLDGCFVAESRRPEEITRLLLKTLDFNGKTAGPEQIAKQGLTADLTAQKLLTIYHQVLKK